ncbi:hypothetical protein [Streptomyces roseirectus]|uniref:hypothetical protein n=1 Tax=Streptomyces roseirectus TaxID=2768066 RepID=UPI001FE874D0|nr:hypothetical protein [Streptomyces roseirectus]
MLGFYEEFDDSVRLNGSVRAAVRAVGEPDEAELVAYLDAGHILIDVMEGGRDVLTGLPHRHSLGCSSPVTDGTWFWRLDLPHYVETHHVQLPAAFLTHVRGLGHRMPPLITARFATLHDAVMPVIGWASAVPWRVPDAVIEPTPRGGPTRARSAPDPLARDRPHGSWAKPRKPRRT